ncbi:MAG TPA: hypothetical protein VF950_10395 [Planctomycetota bacterium]
MRRTAALLLALAALVLPRQGNEPSPLKWLLADAPGSGVGVTLPLLPIALLLAACAGRARGHLLAQAAGSVGLFLIAAWGLVASIHAGRFYVFNVTQAIPILGLALVSFLEAVVFARRPASDRRLVVELLLIQAAGYLTWMACYLIVPAQLNWMAPGGDAILWHFAYPAGLASAFLVTGWGVWARQRWSPWIGAALTGWLAGLTLWNLAHLAFGSQESGLSILLIVSFELASLSLELTSAFFLARLAWRERRAPSHRVA